MKKYCVIDIETSGLNPVNNAICQIAAIVVDENFNEIDRFDMYIKPYGKVYTSQALYINGLTQQFLDKNGSHYTYVFDKFIEFIRLHNFCMHFVGHNVRVFDKKFLSTQLINRNYLFTVWFEQASFYDTMEMSWKDGNIKNCSLEALCKKYNVKYKGKHNALEDCQSTLELFKLFKV